MPFSATDRGVVGAIREVDIEIVTNHRVTYQQEVNSPHPIDSPEFKEQFDSYAADYENQVKQHPQWIVQDQNRDATWTDVVPYQDHYLITVTWTMVGAVTRGVIRAECTYAPGTPEFDLWLNEQAEIYYNNWMREREQYQPL